MTSPVRRRKADAGTTLIEIMVALALFGMIGAAGFAMLDQTLRTREQTDGRLDRLAALQRSLHIISLDFLQAGGRSMVGYAVAEAGAGEGLSLGSGVGAGQTVTRYVLRETILLREFQVAGEVQRVQPLTPGVMAIGWRYLAAGAPDWSGEWPSEAVPVSQIRAVEMTLTLAPGQGTVRRVLALPDGMP